MMMRFDEICRLLDTPCDPALAEAGRLVHGFGLYPDRCDTLTAYVHYSGRRFPERIAQAHAHGALVIVDGRAEPPPGVPCLRVASVRDALLRLARVGRARIGRDAVAITGSVGKTSTKDMTGLVLAAHGPTHCPAGNDNGTLGVSAHLSNVPQGTDFGVIEIGVNARDSVAHRAGIVAPTVAVVTSVMHAHGERFPGPCGLLREKLSVLDALSGRRVAVLHRSVFEQARAAHMLAGVNVDRLVTVGQSPDDTVRLIEVDTGATSTAARVLIGGRILEVRLPVPGRHFVEAAMFALAVARVLDLDLEVSARQCAAFSPPARRAERLRIDWGPDDGRVELIDDAYNASPASVCALLDMLAHRSAVRRRVLVFGDMLELGDEAEALHLSLADAIARSGVDLLVTVGELAGKVGIALGGSVEVLRFPDAAAAAAAIGGLLRRGDLVALKASGGMDFARIVKRLKSSARGVSAAQDWKVEDCDRVDDATMHASQLVGARSGCGD